MKLFALIGNPVKHSISPKMHNLALKGLGLDALYTRYLLEDGSKLKEKFLHLKLDGANVTVPFKEDAFLACDEVKGIANKTRSVNTIVKKDGMLLGFNTDAPGFLLSIKDFTEIKSALIIGAGGTAKAIFFALKEQGIEVEVLNRSQKRLDDFKALAKTYIWEDFSPKKYDLIVNTTSAGLQDEALPMPSELLMPSLKKAKYAFDVIYHKQTPFLKACQKANIAYKNGADMLLYQGVLALELFLDNKYKKEELSFYMKQAF